MGRQEPHGTMQAGAASFFLWRVSLVCAGVGQRETDLTSPLSLPYLGMANEEAGMGRMDGVRSGDNVGELCQEALEDAAPMEV